MIVSNKKSDEPIDESGSADVSSDDGQPDLRANGDAKGASSTTSIGSHSSTTSIGSHSSTTSIGSQASRNSSGTEPLTVAKPGCLAALPPGASELDYRAALTLERVWPRVEAVFVSAASACQSPDCVQDVLDKASDFAKRLDCYWPELFQKLHGLYSSRFDFHFHVEALLVTTAECLIERDPELCAIDRHREIEPNWFQSERIVGGALYVDLFSGNINRLRDNIGYFQDLGITYLHLMPLFAARDGNNDGGYAISDYRAVEPRLGTVAELKQLASDLRDVGIHLVLDFVFNHTSDDHDWAKLAQAGNREYQKFYFIFPDRDQPDQYEQNLREIFPSVRRGSFTWHDGMSQWVWTTFNNFQWDLNYQNPAVFCSMLREMLFIANLGIDALRLDAVAFIWKQMGTGCENLPEAHDVIQAYNLFVRIGAPGLIFKSEAIVHPDEVVKYIDVQECQISYNPTLMALMWESLATRRVNLLTRTLSHRFEIPEGTSWVNYLRCHDDIGWTFDDADAAAIGIDAFHHRQFLNQFYTGRFEGSFARGVPFQENAETGDMRVSGTLASLAGLEEAIIERDPRLVELAIGRMLLMQGVSMSIGGIPLLYLGEEWGTLNDYNFSDDPSKADDSRWIHRPKMDWSMVHMLGTELLSDSAGIDYPEAERWQRSIRERIFKSFKHLIALRKSTHALAGQQMELFDPGDDHLLGFSRMNDGKRLLVLANFCEDERSIDGNRLRTAGLGRFFTELVSGEQISTADQVTLRPYQLAWLVRV